jgi:beta-glucosidase
MGGGSSEVTPHYVVSPLEGITNRVGDDVDVKFELGCPIHKNIPLLDLDWIKNPLSGGKGMYLELFDNLNVQGSPEKVLHIDRTRITWSDELLAGVSPRAFSAKFTADFIAPFSGHFTFSLRGNGMSRMYIDGQIIIDAWDEALSCVEPWDLSERLGTIELDNGKEYRIVIEYSRHGTNNYREFWIGGWPVYAEDPVEKAVALAKEVDLVILVAGLTKEWEREGADRIDMDLPGDQDQLIQKVSEVNSNVVVVLNVGSPVSMPWIDDVAAVLQSWYLGQEAGNAIADILFGDVSPSGKLPTTYPKRYEDNPAFINYPGENGKVHYGEGLHVGYRYYDKSGIEPLFPFGFGLSFTRFAYSHLGIVQNLTGSHAQISLSVNVQNIGQRFGQEVVQLYIRDMESALTRPTKELKGFKKIGLHPGEIKKVEFTLEQDALSYYDDIQDRWVVEPGVFEIQIGSSSRHIHMRDRFEWS